MNNKLQNNDPFKNICIVAYCVLFANFTSLSFFHQYNEIITGAILGAAGALIGLFFYRLLEKRSNATRYIALVSILVATIFLLRQLSARNASKDSPSLSVTSSDSVDFLGITDTSLKRKMYDIIHQPIDTSFVAMQANDLSSIQRRHLTTCEICGYIARERDSSYCYNCYAAVFDSSETNEKKIDWIKNEQLFWFSMDEKQPVDFYKPLYQSGFKKDLKWKPVVSEKDVLKYSKAN
jgi:hypothetical protein